MTKKTSNNKNGLTVVVDEEGMDRALAEVSQCTYIINAQTARIYSQGFIGATDISASIAALKAKTEKVQSGDLSGPEAILIAQAVALDTIFNEMARRAALNIGEHISAMEVYMRLAMKAQGQCRTTLQTLAEIKNPRPVAFVKQANISHGPQQVNNGQVVSQGDAGNGTHAHARDFENPTNKLSGGSDELLPDTRAQGIACEIDSALETVGAVNRPED